MHRTLTKEIISPFLLFLLCLSIQSLFAQSSTIHFKITDENKKGITQSAITSISTKDVVYTDEKGEAHFEVNLPDTILIFAYGYQTTRIYLEANAKKRSSPIEIRLKKLSEELEEVIVQSTNQSQRNISSLGQVEGVQINAAKKSERIKVQQVIFNKSVNTARQIFAKVAGLNVWESDRSGGQLNVGARGLSPNRTSNFNVRQNGYDIAADALGYPESYYTPPLEAIERIDIVRGASSLQYGTQFGGLMNFVFKRADNQNPTILSQANSVGSFGLRHNFTEVGKYTTNWDFYSFYQYRGGNGWRPNSQFDIHTAALSFRFRPSEKFSIQSEYTLLRNLSKQAGGLTDIAFEQDPKISIRDRNWFAVNWNLLNLTLEYRFNSTSRFNSRFFGNFSSRKALGNLERITVIDMGQNRTLLTDNYANIGNESRWIRTFKMGSQFSTLLIGFRYYSGQTSRKQGDGTNESDANFQFINPNNLENSAYEFPSTNYASFIEWIVPVLNNWTITPGLRYEFIRTKAEGFYRQRVLDFAGNTLVDNEIPEQLDRKRDFILFGLGVSHDLGYQKDFYANYSRNYRAITFSDLRIANPNFVVNPTIQDEKGFNVDLGLRGELLESIYFDFSLFYLKYDDRIGLILKTDEPTFPGEPREIGLPPFFVPYRYRTNVADSRTFGLESLTQINWNQIFDLPTGLELNTFLNISLQNGQYISDQNQTINNKQVELVSPLTIRAGMEGAYKSLKYNILYSFTKEHYSDATNTIRSATAVNGIIPSYQVTDITVSYTLNRWNIQTGIQNLFNEIYFTRRADGYPGPGIIPSDPRNWFIRLQFKW